MSNDFGLFFTRDGQILRLPVNPEKLPVARDNANSDYNVLGLGPIMVPRIPKLRVISISSFFPGRPFSGVLTAGGFVEPETYITFFESAMRDKAVILYTPVRYYENGEPFGGGDGSMEVLVTSFQTEERGGETGDFYYDLELTEYKDFTPQNLQVKRQATDTAPAVVTAQSDRSVPSGQLYVGCLCVGNGPYYYTSYRDEPHGTLSGRRVLVSRMVDASRPCPVHVTDEDGGALGWMAAESLEVLEN